ncbi:hypothetical protein [Pedobacter sp. NJ-S-72]
MIVKDTVLGYYGEPGGRLLVKGDLKATNLLNGLMYLFEIEGTVNGKCYTFDTMTCGNGYKPTKIQSNFSKAEELPQSPLIAEVFPYDKDMNEHNFRFEEAYSQLRNGNYIFKELLS